MANPVRIMRIPGSPPASAGLPKIPLYGFRDYFSKPDSAASLGSTEDGKLWQYTGDSVWGIQNGEARLVSATAAVNLAYVDGYSPDLTLVGLVGSGQANPPGWAFRIQDELNFLFLNNGGGKPTLYKRVGGGSSLKIGDSTIAGLNVPGDEMRIVLKGSSIKVYKNGTLCMDVTDGTFVDKTKYGMVGYNNQLGYRWNGIKAEA